MPENVNSDYKNLLKGLVYYYDDKGIRTEHTDAARYKIEIPTDVYGVPKEGKFEISKQLDGNWGIIEMGESRYIPRDKDTPNKLFTIRLESDKLKPNLPVYTVSGNGQIIRAQSGDIISNWYENGIIKSISVRKPEEGRLEYYWYQNGMLQMKKWEKGFGQNVLHQFIMAYDSVGSILVNNGTGFLSGFNAEWGEGRVVNGYKEGLWKGTDSSLGVHYEEDYKMGVVQKGTSYADGKKYQYTSFQVNPEFKDGLVGMNFFLQRNIRYTTEAARENIRGRVFISFIVDEDGKVYDVFSMKKLGYGLDEEAVRVVERMSGLWKPGKVRGRNVKVKYSLPINFAPAD